MRTLPRLLFLVTLTAMLVAPFLVWAHGHGTEWISSNPAFVDRDGIHCCSTDCQPVAMGEVLRVDGGWYHYPTKTTIMDGEKGIYWNRAPDHKTWRCVRGGVMKCIFLEMGM